MKTKLEAIANVVVILVALAVGGVVLTRNMKSSRTSRSVEVGDRLPTVPGLDWSQHRRTLLLVLNTGCHFCQDSVPFYQKLVQAGRHDSSSAEVVAVFPNEAEIVRQFTSQENLAIRTVPGVSLDKLGVNATPTLILVDDEGQVQQSWVGVLAARQEIQVLKLASGL